MRNKIVAILFILLCNCFGATFESATLSQYLQSANSLLLNQQYRLALESANQAVNLAKTDYRGYYLQAQAYQHLNDYSSANSCYQQALALNNNASNLQIAYAGFLCRSGNYSQANNNFASAIQSAVKNHSAITDIYIAYGDCLTL
jgi:Tfp pilus assembly protein PilF